MSFFPRIKKRLLLLLAGTILLVALDLFIKKQVETHWVREWSPEVELAPNEIIRVFPGLQERVVVKETTVIKNFWSFTYTRNYNIGFSLLGFLENYLSVESLALLLKILQLLGLVIILGYFLSIGLKPFLPILLITGGGLGNVLDRWLHGYVIDYVKWYIKDSSIAIFNPWPIFNLSDSLITVGVFSLLFMMIFSSDNSEQGEKPLNDETPSSKENPADNPSPETKE